ncbi:hypothetical protein ACFX10_021028 [Malus domestica]
MAAIPFDESCDVAKALLRCSISPATIMHRIEKKYPIPILCRAGSPSSCLVIFLMAGCRTRLYNGRLIITVIIDINLIDPAGISKFSPMCRSILRACDTTNVPSCAYAIKKMAPEAHIGRVFTTHITSSTCWMLHSLHGFAQDPSSLTSLSTTKAAFFKNLSHQNSNGFSMSMQSNLVS